MDSKQSPIQLLISQNRFKCVTDLSYSKIASYLISHSVSSEDQHVTIKKASSDSADRMDDLLTGFCTSYKNSTDAFDQFRNAVVECELLDLAELLTIDDCTAKKVIMNREILAKVFSYLPISDLRNVRLVCHTWNDVVYTSGCMSSTIQLENSDDLKLYTFSNTKFCTMATNFRLSVKTFSPAEKCLWVKFLERFGNNIESLDLTRLHRDVVELLFSRDMQKFFLSLVRLRLNVSLRRSFVADTPLIFLARQLEHLTIEATRDKSEYGQMDFLSKLLQLDHKLKSLALHEHFCVGPIPVDLKDLFRTNTIEAFEILNQPVMFLTISDIKAMTRKNLPSKLKSVKIDQCSNGFVPPAVVHEFLVSHRHTLKSITFSPSCRVYLNDFPKLYFLITYLEGKVLMEWDALSFCTQFPNLKELNLTIVGEIDIGRFLKFEHNALRTLYLTLGRNVRSSEKKRLTDNVIVSCFPNLKELKINGEEKTF